MKGIERHLSTSHVAELLGCSIRKVQYLVAAGELPWTNVAPRGARRATIRIPMSALAAYQQRRSRAGAA